MKYKTGNQKELDAVLHASAESILELSDSALLEMEKEAGRDIKDSVARFRNVLQDADKEFRQLKTKAAKEGHAKRSKK